MVLLVLLFFFVIPGLIYLLIYGLQPEDRCPICYTKVSSTIDYNYPPFHNGDPNSFDASLIGGTVIRTEPTITNPEGDFVEYISPKESSNEPKMRIYCKFCGVEFKDPNADKCWNCGTPRTL